jgi:hypothetical protein
VLPKWARNAFEMQGSVTLWAGERTDEPARRKVHELPHLNITLRRRICRECNSGFLSQLEMAARPLLIPMMLAREPVTPDAQAQKVIATWAVKTALLLELAWRQHYPGSRPVEGYEASGQEFAWLWRHHCPPPGALVWIGCWDCQKTTPLMYEPSTAGLPGVGGEIVNGSLTTFALGFVAFQVFSVDFLAVEQQQAGLWNTRVPPSLDEALLRIWPPPIGVRTVTWPGAYFSHDDGWRRLVTWDGVLRPGTGRL